MTQLGSLSHSLCPPSTVWLTLGELGELAHGQHLKLGPNVHSLMEAAFVWRRPATWTLAFLLFCVSVAQREAEIGRPEGWCPSTG